MAHQILQSFVKKFSYQIGKSLDILLVRFFLYASCTDIVMNNQM
jgi:hypothetical protein